MVAGGLVLSGGRKAGGEPSGGRDTSLREKAQRCASRTVALKVENEFMSLSTFLDTLSPHSGATGKGPHWTALREQAGDADVYWYPGSGRDLTPLMLDVPSNPSGRRVFRPGRTDASAPAQVLWMNDPAFPEWLDNEPPGGGYTPGYWALWRHYRAHAEVGSRVETYSTAAGQVAHLFTVTVWNDCAGVHARPRDGDAYLVIYSPMESERLFREVFLPHRIRVTTVALIKQGGMSGQRPRFPQYIAVPEILQSHANELGPVDFYAIDGHGQVADRPLAPAIQDYWYAGGTLDWGWIPWRVFARPGVAYARELRDRRNGMLANLERMRAERVL